MSVALVVRDVIRASVICVNRHPAARLSRAEWIANGVKASLKHSRSNSLAGDPEGFRALVYEYAQALRDAEEDEAAEIVLRKKRKA